MIVIIRLRQNRGAPPTPVPTIAPEAAPIPAPRPPPTAAPTAAPRPAPRRVLPTAWELAWSRNGATCASANCRQAYSQRAECGWVPAAAIQRLLCAVHGLAEVSDPAICRTRAGLCTGSGLWADPGLRPPAQLSATGFVPASVTNCFRRIAARSSYIRAGEIPKSRWALRRHPDASRVPRAFVGRARLAEKQDERADDQHGEHQNLELIDDCDDGRLAGDHVVERGEPRPGD